MPRFGLSAAVLVTAASLVGWGAADAMAATPAATPPPATQVVSYQGLHFTVPAGWPVIDVSASSTTCVRFDRHAVYLGTPGANQHCPATVIGRTEALLLQPGNGTTTPTADHPVAHEITATAAQVSVTATYGQDEATVRQILASAGLAAPTVARATPQAARPFASSTTLSTEYTGSGFDTCAAPSSATMNAWLASPYRSIGIYIGGADRACAQPNLTASWVSQQVAAGWHFQPLYVGPQASAGEITAPASQAVTAADDAIAQANTLGFGPGSLLYYDMQNYPAAQSSAAVAFMSAWTVELRAKGYQSGIYGSMSSTIADVLQNAGLPGFTMPDVLFFADWNGTASTSEAGLTPNYWANHQLAHQYAGNVTETFGGVTLSTDDDFLDVQQWCHAEVGTLLARGDVGFCNWTRENDNRSDFFGEDDVAVGSDGTQMTMDGNSNVVARSGVGLGGWTRESDRVSRIATNDGIQMITSPDGTVYAKDTIGLYGWVRESDPGARQIAIGTDGTQMIIGSDGDVYAKTGIGLYGWTRESDPAEGVATNDGIQMIMGMGGAIYAKTGIGLYGWTKEADPNTFDFTVGSDGTQMVMASDLTVWAKTGIGLYGWTKESDPAQRIVTNDGIQMIIGKDGAVYAKTGIGLYGWTKETDPGAVGVAEAIAIGSDGTQLFLS